MVNEIDIDCGDPGLHRLSRGGTYTIIVGENDNDSTGTYGFWLVGQYGVSLVSPPLAKTGQDGFFEVCENPPPSEARLTAEPSEHPDL